MISSVRAGLAMTALCLAAVVCLPACERKGDPGPTGPAGPPGVIYSEWMATGAWTLSSDLVTHAAVRYVGIAASQLTQDIIDHGVILVYVEIGGAPIAIQLPWTDTFHGTAWAYHATVGGIFPYYSFYLTPNNDPGDAGSQLVRYVLIPGGVAASAARSAGVSSAEYSARLRTMPYAAVCRQFEIPR